MTLIFFNNNLAIISSTDGEQSKKTSAKSYHGVMKCQRLHPLQTKNAITNYPDFFIYGIYLLTLTKEISKWI